MRSGNSFWTSKLDNSLRYSQNALSLAKAAGDIFRMHKALHNLASVYHLRGNWRRAISYYEDAERTAVELGNLEGTLFTRNNRCMLHIFRGEWNQARRLATSSKRRAETGGLAQPELVAHLYLSMIRLQQDRDAPGALAMAEEVTSAIQKLSFDSVTAAALCQQASCYLAMENWLMVISKANQALTIAYALNEIEDYARALRYKACALSALSNLRAAQDALSKSLELLEREGYDFESAVTKAELGLLMARLGDESNATTLLVEAQSILHQLRAAQVLLMFLLVPDSMDWKCRSVWALCKVSLTKNFSSKSIKVTRYITN